MMAIMLRPSPSIALPFGLLVLGLLYYMLKTPALELNGMSAMAITTAVKLPADLEARVFNQFNDLLERGVVAYQVSDVELFEEKGFQVRISASRPTGIAASQLNGLTVRSGNSGR